MLTCPVFSRTSTTVLGSHNGVEQVVASSADNVCCVDFGHRKVSCQKVNGESVRCFERVRWLEEGWIDLSIVRDSGFKAIGANSSVLCLRLRIRTRLLLFEASQRIV